MPEGPSIIILKEAVQEFKGQKIISVTGNSRQDIQRLEGQKIIDFKSWGKHFLICFKSFAVRIHLCYLALIVLTKRPKQKQQG
jgi:endonuclease-8